jgi:hypothetical protein
MCLVFVFLLMCANGLIACESPKKPNDHTDQPVKKRVEGDIFIVPNSLWTIGGEERPYDTKCAEIHKLFGLEAKEGNRCAEVWTTDKDAKDSINGEVIREQFARGLSANWADHGHPVLGPSFPDLFPVALLADGPKEGDTIEVDYTNKQTDETFRVVLTCAQLKHRYKHFYDPPKGFHEVLEQLMKARSIIPTN